MYKQAAIVATEIAGRLKFKDGDLIHLFSCLNGTWPFAIHTGMFIMQLLALGTDAQAKYWVPRARSLEVIGCYAQTELSHGSDIQGLETTATYDIKTDEFVIHTPSLGAAKFWPGDMAKLANHAALIAKLIIDGKDHGIQTFVIPIRDSKTHAVLRGVELGDIGPKHGFQNKDNGYAVFQNFRVPRSALLSRYVRVERDGTVLTRGDPKVAYFTIMGSRIFIIKEAHLFLARPLAIALRYSAFRTQFRTNPDSSSSSSSERKILDYQNQ